MTVTAKNSQISKLKKDSISPFLRNRIIHLKRMIELDMIDNQNAAARAKELQSLQNQV